MIAESYRYDISAKRLPTPRRTQCSIPSTCCNNDSHSLQIDLARNQTRFQGQLAIPDYAASPAPASVSRSLRTGSPTGFVADIGFGYTIPIDLSVVGVLRLKIVYLPNDNFCGSSYRYLFIGNLIFTRALRWCR